MSLNLKQLGVGGVVDFKVWTAEEHDTWRMLCERQMHNLEGKVSKIYKQGWEKLNLSVNQIPDFAEINKILANLNGWEVVMTDIVYEDNISWISALKDKKFRVTNFIRDKKDLDYTPLPDIFHDCFGHLPFLGVPQYSRILEKFGQVATIAKEKGDEKLQQDTSRLGWYAYEFGFMKEEGENKAFGTGLVSSYGELLNALSEKVVKLPYDPLVVTETEISPEKFHQKLFVLENLDQLEAVVDDLLVKANSL